MQACVQVSGDQLGRSKTSRWLQIDYLSRELEREDSTWHWRWRHSPCTYASFVVCTYMLSSGDKG